MDGSSSETRRHFEVRTTLKFAGGFKGAPFHHLWCIVPNTTKMKNEISEAQVNENSKVPIHMEVVDGYSLEVSSIIPVFEEGNIPKKQMEKDHIKEFFDFVLNCSKLHEDEEKMIAQKMQPLRIDSDDGRVVASAEAVVTDSIATDSGLCDNSSPTNSTTSEEWRAIEANGINLMMNVSIDDEEWAEILKRVSGYPNEEGEAMRTVRLATSEEPKVFQNVGYEEFHQETDEQSVMVAEAKQPVLSVDPFVSMPSSQPSTKSELVSQVEGKHRESDQVSSRSKFDAVSAKMDSSFGEEWEAPEPTSKLDPSLVRTSRRSELASYLLDQFFEATTENESLAQESALSNSWVDDEAEGIDETETAEKKEVLVGSEKGDSEMNSVPVQDLENELVKPDAAQQSSPVPQAPETDKFFIVEREVTKKSWLLKCTVPKISEAMRVLEDNKKLFNLTIKENEDFISVESNISLFGGRQSFFRKIACLDQKKQAFEELVEKIKQKYEEEIRRVEKSKAHQSYNTRETFDKPPGFYGGMEADERPKSKEERKKLAEKFKKLAEGQAAKRLKERKRKRTDQSRDRTQKIETSKKRKLRDDAVIERKNGVGKNNVPWKRVSIEQNSDNDDEI